MLRTTAFMLFSVALTVLGGCESYDFTVNEKLIYTPKKLFSDFDVPDETLKQCIEQAIVDNKITAANELTLLNCSHAGIINLTGLERFTSLVQLKLSSNKIRNLSPITALIHLETLYLDDNVVVDPVPLYKLSTLRILNLSGNTPLQCPDPAAFTALESTQLPDHCG